MPYDSHLARDKQTGAMMRQLMGDMGEELKATLEDLYKDNDGNLSDAGASCAKWHHILAKFSIDPYMMRKYIAVIQIADRYGLNLDELQSWKRLLRYIVPEAFFEKVNKMMTQVPQMATMIGQKKKKPEDDIVDASEFQW